MRYRLAVLMLLMLLVVLPMMNVLAAPAPDPSAILDIGPPPKGMTAEQHRKQWIEGQTFHGTLGPWWTDPEVKKLPSVARLEDARPWLAKNLRVTPGDGERRLRFTFRAGNRNEQVTIINALLRVDLRLTGEHIKWHEEWLRQHENDILRCEKCIESAQPHESVDSERKEINELRTNQIPARRAEIARYKQIAVIKWAR